jgi:hypothetical protein
LDFSSVAKNLDFKQEPEPKPQDDKIIHLRNLLQNYKSKIQAEKQKEAADGVTSKNDRSQISNIDNKSLGPNLNVPEAI